MYDKLHAENPNWRGLEKVVFWVGSGGGIHPAAWSVGRLLPDAECGIQAAQRTSRQSTEFAPHGFAPDGQSGTDLTTAECAPTQHAHRRPAPPPLSCASTPTADSTRHRTTHPRNRQTDRSATTADSTRHRNHTPTQPPSPTCFSAFTANFPGTGAVRGGRLVGRLVPILCLRPQPAATESR